ncbi:MAG TPA: metal-dependent hydrolase [Candidatus Acidoferrales bacterium]|nr:metal-dependent hydrolase [Candidatus Acidoferrales bacterium]
MDTITHGIAGALIGKAFFDGEDLFTRKPATARRVASIAATLGAIFPDADIIHDVLSRDPLTLLKWHRSWTHSVVMLPAFALALAALTRYVARKRSWPSPSFAVLLLIYGVGIASHIFLDYATSFGTMLWTPLSRAREQWDLLFIIDFTLTAVVLLPQFVAALYRARDAFPRRALQMWLGFSICAGLAAWLQTLAEFPPSLAAVLLVMVALAALFFAPAVGGWGYRASFKNWNRAGFAAFVVYIGMAAFAHHSAMTRVETFAAEKGIGVETLGALPLPPSLLHWDGLVRTPRGVYEVRMNLRDPYPSGLQDPIEYRYYPDAPPNEFLAAARQLPTVRTYLWFARFPVYRWRKEGDNTVVEFNDLRFLRSRRRPSPFTYRVVYGAQGNVLSQGWAKE